VHAGAAVGLAAPLVRLADEHRQPHVLDGALRRRPPAPGVEPGARDLEQPAELRDAVEGLLRVDEREPHFMCFA
jgi:hypothetical protein